MDYANESLSDIVLRIPMASELFRKNRLDYCCGGKKNLKDACAERNLNIGEIMATLKVLETKEGISAKETRPLDEITAFVVKRYHDDLRVRLPELVFLADKIERVHNDHIDCPHGLAALMQNITDELFSHMMKEENILFPMINAGHGTQAGMPINRMMFEHDAHGKDLEKIHGLTNSFNPPKEACGSWRALYKGLQDFEAELMEHIHLENNVLFPRALRGG